MHNLFKLPNSPISGKPESPQSDGVQSIPPELTPRTVLDLRVELIVANEEIERLRDQLDAATTGRASAAEGYRDVISAISKERDLCRSALALIAITVRPDGTYNRSREACEKLAREALMEAHK